MSGCVPRTFPTCTDLSNLSMEKMRHNSIKVSLGRWGGWKRIGWVGVKLERFGSGGFVVLEKSLGCYHTSQGFCSTQLRIEYKITDVGKQYKFFFYKICKKSYLSEFVLRTIFTSYTCESFLLRLPFHFVKQRSFL